MSQMIDDLEARSADRYREKRLTGLLEVMLYSLWLILAVLLLILWRVW